jgi:amino acid transporter
MEPRKPSQGQEAWPSSIDPSQQSTPENDLSWNAALWNRLRHFLIGKARSLEDSSLFHKVALIPVLAWVGMGADGLSSSAYGPEESFKVIQQHLYLVPFVVLASILTIFIISVAYSRVIEHFPHGGGGYVVASHLLGPKAGLISGCALTVDYVLTITVSVAAGGDALFSLFPPQYQQYKLAMEAASLIFLVVMNLRGVKESVLAVAPVFFVFVISHIILIAASFFMHASEIPVVAQGVGSGFSQGLSALGWVGLAALFLKAYSMGAGTYTGIEAVSNGLGILREPQVVTGKRTMVYMAVSLAVAAGGLFLAYLLAGIHPAEGMTMNAILASAVFGSGSFGQGWFKDSLILATLVSEAGLLVIAAQTGFIDGPRVMANMAMDSWFPKRFSSLSERFTMQNGVLLFGLASIAALLYTKGSVDILVVMYSINVFITFSLTEFSMSRFYFNQRRSNPGWLGKIYIHLIGLTLCSSILVVMIMQKFMAGGWITMVITVGLVAFCLAIRRYYDKVGQRTRKLDSQLMGLIFDTPPTTRALDPSKPTAVMLVDGYSSVGIHSLFSAFKIFFPDHFKNVVFVSVGAVNSGNFKGQENLEALHDQVRQDLEKYADLARRMDIPAAYEMEISTDVIGSAAKLCAKVAREYPHCVVFGGKLIFQRERWYQRWMHNQSVVLIQNRLQWEGIPMTVLPVRVFE